MAPRWISWILASTVLPALPWVFRLNIDKNGDVVLVLTFFALAVQLVTSVLVAAGISQRKNLGVGGIIGFTLLFMMGSVAVGTALWFAGCLTTIGNMNFH